MSDLISRQDAIEVADAVWTVTGDKNVEKVWDQIKDLPSAQPETANIIVGKSRDGMTMWYQCDNCNEPVDENDLYCRGCGRRLKHGSNR